MPVPFSIEPLVDELSAIPGVIAVVLGGSRAAGVHHPGSDWDLGVYYRGDVDWSVLARHGELHPPGSWGRVMNGGAWLRRDDAKVDVLLRSLDVVDHWSTRAQDGEYEVDALLGYLAGVPTYSLLAERAVAIPLRGTLAPVGPFPARLAEVGRHRWRFHARFSLDYARTLAARCDRIGAMGEAAKAIIEHAHGVLCERREWVLNEKRIVERAGLAAARDAFASAPADDHDLEGWLAAVDRALR